MLPIEIVYAKETLDAGDSGYGVLLSAWGVGMVVGSLVFAAGARVADRCCSVAAQHAAIGFAYLGHGGSRDPVRRLRGRGVGGLGNGVQWVSVMSAVQELTAASTRPGSSGCSSRSGG